MAKPSLRTKAIVLKKTSLGESDLILTLLAEDGSQLRAVAKGARKPQSAASSRLELFSAVDANYVVGRNLHTLTETRLVEAHEALRWMPERTAVASVVAELLAKTTQPGLAHGRLYEATNAALRAMAEAAVESLGGICAAACLKTLAFEGFRPSLALCVGCGDTVQVEGPTVRFSHEEGGICCAGCRAHMETVPVSAEALLWARRLMGSTYEGICALEPHPASSLEVLRLCQGLIRFHVGSSLRSLEFLFTSGLF